MYNNAAPFTKFFILKKIFHENVNLCWRYKFIIFFKKLKNLSGIIANIVNCNRYN